MPPVSSGLPSLSMVVPLFNEEARVSENGPGLVDFVSRCGSGSELILVDDGSTDGTIPAVEGLRRRSPDTVRILRLPHRGKGAALRAGLGEARAEYAGFTDIDLSAPLDQLEVVFKAATMAGVLAIGSRDLPTSRVTRPQHRARELLGKSYNRLIQLSLVPGVADTQCGAKFASVPVWKAVLPWCQEDGFAWDVEVLAIARRLGIPVQEIGIEWWHDERTRVRVGPDGLKMVLALPRIAGHLKDVPVGRPAPAFDDAPLTPAGDPDAEHWWFRCESILASSVLRRHLPARLHDAVAVDLAAGAGGVTASLGWRPDRLLALEGSEESGRRVHDRHSLTAVVGARERMPIRTGGVGVVMALDVIEHLDAPQVVLREARRALCDRGLLLVGVPAHEWLWSGSDEALGHVRRYTRPLLRRQLEAAGFRVLWMSHVFSWLVAPAWLRRGTGTGTGTGGTGTGGAAVGRAGQRSPRLDRAAMVLTALERAVVRVAPLPFGTSILAVATVARAPDEHASA